MSHCIIILHLHRTEKCHTVLSSYYSNDGVRHWLFSCESSLDTRTEIFYKIVDILTVQAGADQDTLKRSGAGRCSSEKGGC